MVIKKSAKAKGASDAQPSRGFDRELAELDALSEALKAGASFDPAVVEQLRKALAGRNNFLVAKAARLAAEAELFPLLPEVLAAYDRFFVDPVKTDPQCWAKNALAKALVKLEHRDKDAYVRGLRHYQLESVWGGKSDTSAALRGTCAHALVACPGIRDDELLSLLIEALVDTDKTVRMEAARALSQVGGVAAGLLLRLRALQGVKPIPDEPEVLGACYASLLAVEGARAIPLVAASLAAGDDLAAEAAYALADTRMPEALAALIARRRSPADEWFGGVLDSAIALTRLPEAMDYLLAVIAGGAREASSAIEAMGRVAPSVELRDRVWNAVQKADSQRLAQAFREHFPLHPDPPAADTVS